MKVFVETERLILRELVDKDASAIFELDSDPLVHTYLGNNPMQTMKQSKEVIEFVRKQYSENGIGRWATIEKESGDFIGWTGLKVEDKLTNGHVNYNDLGFRFKPKYWGKGYATEALGAVVKFSHTELALNRLEAWTIEGNVASDRVLIKNGFLSIMN